METMIMRFPHLSEMIFDRLDNHSLANCKIVSKTWSIYIGEQKFYGIRILKEIVKKFHKLSKSWFEVFQKANTKTIMELKNCFNQSYEGRKQKPKEVTPLHVSAASGNILLYESIHKFAKTKQPRTEDGHEPVVYAIFRGHVKMALLIIERMIDKNPVAENGWTALCMAAKYGYVDVCELILKHLKDKNPKIKRNKTNNYGDTTPLHIAASCGHIRICELIMKQIDEKNPKDGMGRAPFHLAALLGRLEVCELYMKTIGHNHPRTNAFDTPLHLAAFNGHLKVCMLILQSAKEKNPRNHCNKTPLTLARENNQFKVCWLLEKDWNCVE
jgi:hypothetical protein